MGRLPRKKDTQVPNPNRIGRPSKYNPDIHPDIVYKVCKEFGAKDVHLADVLGIGVDVLYKWKQLYPTFRDAVKNGKLQHDTSKVQDALLKRALGFTHTIKSQSKNKETGEITIREKKEYYPPETKACMFWLTNRHPERWTIRKEKAITRELRINLSHLSREELLDIRTKLITAEPEDAQIISV